MTGRHRPPRRHHAAPRLSGTWSAVAAGLAVLVVLTGSWGAYRLLAEPRCNGRVALTVAASPDIAPAVQHTADTDRADLRAAGNCVDVKVTATEPADVAAAIAGRHHATMSGVGAAGGRNTVPDVWIPDSSMWLERLRSAGPTWVPDEAPSVARSPVVLAMPVPAATTLGWPAQRIGWSTVLQKLTSDIQLRTGIVDPQRDAAGLAGLLALAAAGGGTGAAAAGAPADPQALIGALRALATGQSTLRDELLARFPRAGDAATLSSSLGAAPLSEQAVIAFNGRQPPVPLAALYLDPAPVPLDYPYTILPGATAQKVTAAHALQGVLSGDAYRDRLAAAGLRADDGSTGRGFAAPRGAPGSAPLASLPVPDAIDTALSTWTAVTSPGRLLAVVDVSGSMLTPVPTARGATREQVTVEAARNGLGLFDDTWAVGLWEFSTQLDGANDYRQLVSIGPLSDNRQALATALGGIQPKPDGNTGLYDTTLAAYRAVQAGWDPSRVNSVVILTDGQNDDQQGLGLDQLIGQLKQVMDPKRPVQVIAIGIGTDVSEAELKRITDTTGGGTFIAPDPSKVGDIFLKAIALRPGVRR